jgi:adenylylsulfate kinase
MNNLKYQSYEVARKDYQDRNKHRSFVIWFTGLSGSGKSTIANALNSYLFHAGYQSVVLDGDNTRLGINKDLSFNENDRSENIRRVSEIAKLFIQNGQIAITAFISPFEKDRLQAKNNIGNDDFIEVFIDCPLEECEKRDVKGLYNKARKGEIENFTGISSPFESPKNCDIRIESQKQNIEESVNQILQFLKSHTWLPTD